MIEKLIVDFFNAIEEKEGIDSINGKADFLTIELLENRYNKPNYISNRKATRLYLKHVEKKKDISVSLKDKFLKDVIASYLEYENYLDFTEKNPTVKKSSFTTKKNGILTSILSIDLKKNKIQVLISSLIIVTIIFYNSLQGKRWMIWQQNRYIEVSLNLKKYNINQLKKYNQRLIDSFKKINSPDCNSIYLTEKGKAKVWYWKKNNEEIEVYTQPGLHPKNGKTLKPITRHMIRKYICPD